MWHTGGPWDSIFNSYMSYPARIIVTPQNDLKANLTAAVAPGPGGVSFGEVQPLGSGTNVQLPGGDIVPVSAE